MSLSHTNWQDFNDLKDLCEKLIRQNIWKLTLSRSHFKSLTHNLRLIYNLQIWCVVFFFSWNIWEIWFTCRSKEDVSEGRKYSRMNQVNFLKAVFHKFYLIHLEYFVSDILRSMWCSMGKKIITDQFLISVLGKVPAFNF